MKEREKIDVNVGNEGLEYIQWAHSNGYKSLAAKHF